MSTELTTGITPILSSQRNEVIGRFKALLLARGNVVSDGDLAFASGMVAAWNAPDDMDHPVVFAAECGFGKSTLLEVYLRYMTATDPQFGAIVVKQKKDEVEALTNAINRNDSVEPGRVGVRHRRAFAIRGYDPSVMSYESHRQQFSRQAYNPIVVMTAEMFARQSSMRVLDRFSSFYDRDEQRRPRRLLVIDERPVLTRTHSVSVEDINRLIEDVRVITHQPNQRMGSSARRGINRDFREFLSYAQKLRSNLEECEGRDRMPPIDFDYVLPDSLRRLWADHYEGVDFEALATFEGTVRYGGMIYLRRNITPVVTVSHRVYYEWTAFRPFILDATAATDPYYAAGNFVVMEAPNPHAYSNVQFHVCTGENLSKSFFENHHQSFEEVAGMVREIADKHRKTMVVFYKEHLPQLEGYLAEDIQAGRVVTKHFDSGRASNDYKDCDAAVFLGWLLKGEAYYPQVASAIYDELLSYESWVDMTGVHYRDTRVESFKVGELVTERIQDVHRIRPRSSDYPVSVYLFHRDEQVLGKIIGNFPGAHRREFIPRRQLKGPSKNVSNLIEFFRSMAPGSRVKSKEIYESLGIHRNTFASLQADGDVIEAMSALGVYRERTFYIKRLRIEEEAA